MTIAPTKKNRLASTSEEQTTSPTPKEASGSDAETGKVGEVRRKVQEMTWKEGSGEASGDKPQDWEELQKDEVEEAKKNAVEDTQAQAQAQAQSKENGTASESEGGVKRKPLDRNDSSILEKTEPVKKVRDTPSVRPVLITIPTSHSYSLWGKC